MRFKFAERLLNRIEVRRIFGERQGVTRQQFPALAHVSRWRRALDIRLRPWAFRPGIGLLPRRFCCAKSPVVAVAIRNHLPMARRGSFLLDYDRENGFE